MELLNYVFFSFLYRTPCKARILETKADFSVSFGWKDEEGKNGNSVIEIVCKEKGLAISTGDTVLYCL